ncbi:hypothetical protein TVAGG3_0240390, partial [Trichomonas vaginalis G3]|uniref:hypothetical protein n=1 Tax=Trichomonas vaginalis (strain ATCC PRA-98 / G3) TaxID=412133 RepID=UPI0021E5878F
PSSTNPFVNHISGSLFQSITNEGVIRINSENSILILEHDTFNTITSNQNGGCVFFSPGHSIYQRDTCAHKVYSSTKAKFSYVKISQALENVDYNFMISITDCTPDPVSDIFWIGGGKTSLSNYNSTNNYASFSTAFYFGNSVGQANASFINVLSGTATYSSLVYSDSNCILKHSNFYNNKVNEKTECLLAVHASIFVIDHCVFAQNSAQIFANNKISVLSCSFYENSFSSTYPSIPYSGTHSFTVNTQCHMWKHDDCIKKYSCVSQYFTINSFLFSFSIFILFL